ncbi:MAG: 4-hydroxy-tetrahydrodipicolinate reductase [Bacteroidota bacterium]
MRITIIGYGRMGREVENIALEKGHEIILRIDKDNTHDFDSEIFQTSDVAIEFSTPETALANIRSCLIKGIPVVSGTTGWTENLAEAKDLAQQKGTAFLYASNFSIGVNIMFNLNRRLAAIMDQLPAYSVNLEEIHHTMKKDAPSGTAISLAGDIISECGRYDSWTPDQVTGNASISIRSVREGQVPGTHRVVWESANDAITLEHKAHSRQGFALGAIIAAEFIHKRQGVFTMSDLLGF